MTTSLSGDACSLSAQGEGQEDVFLRRRGSAVRRDEHAPALAINGEGQWLSMSADDTLQITDVRDFPVRCRDGTLWITSPECPGDIVVFAGEQLDATSRGTILIAALSPAQVWVPEGFSVDQSRGASRRYFEVKEVRGVAQRQRRAAVSSDVSHRPKTEMRRLTPLQKLVELLRRMLRPRPSIGRFKRS